MSPFFQRPLELGAAVARDRGRIVILGDVGLSLSRQNAYQKELSITFSRSYGPGRYDPQYEEAGIDYEVVPGITAALAAASSVKRSLTLRGVARSVALATKSRAPDTEEIREHVNADSLVFYMGRDSAPEIAQQLIDAGRARTTPTGSGSRAAPTLTRRSTRASRSCSSTRHSPASSTRRSGCSAGATPTPRTTRTCACRCRASWVASTRAGR